ncbi:MAG: hypothetical protein EP146_17850 [Oscillibacter sp.]|uniref:RNA polymerase sigma factor n=1 Tax=Oscillibacter sp. TaxID=1945593 RepID=UPI00132A84D7|nr:sigma factor [Oscillibacter sp.]MUU13016.1 hypothetical protein [Oscillibacter sp.]
MEDTEIIDLYWQRDQRAIDETHGKYGGFLAGIAWNILRSHSDAEECVNDTYLRTWNAIPPARPSAFRAWLGRIVRNLSLDRWKQSRTAKRGGDGMEVLLGSWMTVCRSPRNREDDGGPGNRVAHQRVSAAAESGEPHHLPAAVLVRAECGGYCRRNELRRGKVKSSLPRKALRTYLEQEEVFCESGAVVSNPGSGGRKPHRGGGHRLLPPLYSGGPHGSAFGRGRMSRGDLRRGVGTVAIESGSGHRQPRRCRAGRWRIRR